MVVLCFLTCLVLLYSYYALLGKYRKMKEDMRENTVQVEGVQKEKYQKSRVDEEEVSRIKQRLTECMNKDKMYLNPDTRNLYLNYEKLLTSAGICFLHNEHMAVELQGSDFVFHGLELPIEYYHKPNSPALSLTTMEELIGMPSQPGVHVLLAHNPKYGNTYFSWGADLILSGHYHGGILRLNENHGLTCPQFLFLPPYCCGKFTRGSQHMIVSAGLGEHTIPIRIHNPRELILVDLVPDRKHTGNPHQNRKVHGNGNSR